MNIIQESACTIPNITGMNTYMDWDGNAVTDCQIETGNSWDSNLIFRVYLEPDYTIKKATVYIRSLGMTAEFQTKS